MAIALCNATTTCMKDVLSKSNVQLHEIEIKGKLYDEIVTMLRTQRAFNGCSKILQSEIDITKKLSAR